MFCNWILINYRFQLPYYIDEKCAITQSLAILRYIADKHGMIGSTPEERARVSMIEGAAVDLRNGLSRISYDSRFNELKEGYLNDLPTTLQIWSKFLGANQYLRGSSVSHVDFMVYEALDVIRYLDPHCLDKFSNLQQFMSRIEALPSIKAYMESKRFIKWPLNGWNAHFGGGDAPPISQET
ncbi:Allergen Aca s 8 [Fasciolopsis buskii]|uniref:glutathione transferase n=1 Tax=Fasciolopsis buskii TaxID=27845 RepID=A0A8E0S1L2_9TREM|nr:Allergen Aca s 8 [Fasciolopsis buski]